MSYPARDIYSVDSCMKANSVPERILGLQDPEVTILSGHSNTEGAAVSQKERLSEPRLSQWEKQMLRYI